MAVLGPHRPQQPGARVAATPGRTLRWSCCGGVAPQVLLTLLSRDADEGHPRADHVAMGVGSGKKLPHSHRDAPAVRLLVTRPAAAVDDKEKVPCTFDPEPGHLQLQLIPVLVETDDALRRYDASRPLSPGVWPRALALAAKCCVTKAPVAAEAAGVVVAVVPSLPSVSSQQVAGALDHRCDDVRMSLSCLLIQANGLTWDPAERLLRLVTVEHAPAAAAAVPWQETQPANWAETPVQS